MSAYLLLSPSDVEDVPESHEELVRAQRPAPSLVMEAAAVLGLFAEGSYLAGEVRVSLSGLNPYPCLV